MKSLTPISVKKGNTLSLVKVLHALADVEEEKACGLFGIDMPKSSLSHHFGILRKSGVILSESRGTLLMNRLRRKALEARFPGVLVSILAAARLEHGTI